MVKVCLIWSHCYPLRGIFQLYNYVLSHEKAYDFRVLRMEPLYVESDGGQFNCDYVLARQTQHKLSYSFNSDKRNSDEFDMTLIVGHVEDPVKDFFSTSVTR